MVDNAKETTTRARFYKAPETFRYRKAILRASAYEPGQPEGLARFPRSHVATLFFVKTSMCLYERPGWPGYRDLDNRDENFPI